MSKSVCVLKRKINDVLFENIFLESAISMEIWTKNHANLIENCKQLTNIPKNSSQKLKGAANLFVLFADSWSNF